MANRTDSRHGWIWWVASALVLAMVLWLLHDRVAAPTSRSQPSHLSRAASTPPRLEPRDQDDRTSALHSIAEPVAANDTSDPESRRLAGASIDRTVELYRETMVDRLSSRPAGGANTH